MSALDWNDGEARRAWLAALTAAIDDDIAVTDDMLRPLRDRRLGPAEARRIHGEATSAIRALLDAAK